MDAWFHCENPYPYVPDEVLNASDSVRASLPNRYCDPKVAAQLFEETLDEYLLCDELGLNITSSEHHAGINCLYGASPVILGIVARQTKNIRLLSKLGWKSQIIWECELPDMRRLEHKIRVFLGAI